MSNTNTKTKKFEQNKITVSEFEKAVRGAQTRFFDVEWNGLMLHIRHQVNLEYMIRYVDYVVAACFDANTGEYLPEAKDFAIRSGAVEFFTNITLPDDVNRKYNLMYGTDIINVVMSYVDAGQMNSLLIAIDKKLDYLANANIERVRKQLNDVTQSFAELSNTMEQAFSGITGEEISKIASAVAGGAFDEAKLVQLFAEQKLMSGNEQSSDNVIPITKE